jgi:hypothetical protein
MGRTMGAAFGVALLLVGPAWASSMVEITGTLATEDAASGGASSAVSALRGAKSALDRNIPKFTPPKIEAMACPTASGAPSSTRPSAPSVHSALGGGGWKTASAGGSTGTGKSAWASASTPGHGPSTAKGKGWATAASAGHARSGASAWKGGAGSTGSHH